jgi:hypothetical protein
MTAAEKREKPGAELHAMGAIVGPFAARLDEDFRRWVILCCHRLSEALLS